MTKSVLFSSLASVCLLFTGISASAQAIVNGATYKITRYGTTADGSAAAFGVAAGSPLCLDVDSGRPDAGALIGQWGDNNFAAAQHFVLELQTDGSYKIRHWNTPMYLQPIGLAKTANTQIEQNVTSNNDAQRWIITDPNNNGRYKFALKGSANAAGVSQVLEVGFASAAPGAKANLFDDNGFEPAQRWLLTVIAQPLSTKNAAESVLKTQAYPNPSAQGQSLTVQVQALHNGAADVVVLDLLGHVVHKQQETLKSGINLVALANKPLAAGVYVVRVAQGAFIQQTRVVQQ